MGILCYSNGMRLHNGQPITLIDVNGEHHEGELFLPDETYLAPATGDTRSEAQSATEDTYGTWTILQEGHKFRTEGRLYR